MHAGAGGTGRHAARQDASKTNRSPPRIGQGQGCAAIVRRRGGIRDSPEAWAACVVRGFIVSHRGPRVVVGYELLIELSLNQRAAVPPTTINLILAEPRSGDVRYPDKLPTHQGDSVSF